MNAEKRRQLLETLKAAYPEAKTELLYDSTFELLVAVLLSAQMTDKGVNKATRVLFPRANTPAALLALGEATLLEHLKSINLYKTKTRHLLQLSDTLIRDHAGEVPSTREALEALPGVGRKTANVVLSIAFQQPTFAVDTHVFRVCNRTKLAVGKTPLAVEMKLLKVVPASLRAEAHHWLILHGRYVCKATAPNCAGCVIREMCEYAGKKLPPYTQRLSRRWVIAQYFSNR